MIALPPVLATAAAALAAIAINSLWEGALIVACVWLLLRAWPRVNAATRYLVWCAALGAVVVVPVVTTLPFFHVPAAAVAAPALDTAGPAAPVAREARPSRPHSTVSARERQRPAPANAAEPRPAVRLPERFRVTMPQPLAYAVVAIWALLAALALVRLALGLRSLERLKRDALPLPVEYREAMARWTAVNKGAREVRLCVSDDVDVPVAVGLFDSMILIPRELLERLSESEVDQISLHELAHLRRADDWSNCFQRIALALMGWNPAARFAGAQLDLEREVACDDWVLSLTGSVRPYAMCLTKMAETTAWPRHAVPAPGVFATRKHISMRIERLLGAGRNVATTLALGPAAGALAIVGVLAFVMGLVAPSVAATAPAAATAVQPSTPAVAASLPAVAIRPATQREIHRTVAIASAAAESQAPSPSPAPPKAAPAAPSVPAIPAGVNALVQRKIRESLAKSLSSIESVGAGAGAGVPASRAVADSSSARSCTGCEMQGVDWSGRDMRGVNYTGVNLSHAHLAGTDFSGGTFDGVDFSHADLHHANFQNARLTGCDFSYAILTNVDFTGAKMSGCQFTGAQMTAAVIRSVLDTCTGCDFTNANLSGLDLSGVRANGIDFTRANLTGVNLSGSQFTGVDFTRASLAGANLNGTVLNGCDLAGVDLTHVDLSKAKLIGTDLSEHRRR